MRWRGRVFTCCCHSCGWKQWLQKLSPRLNFLYCEQSFTSFWIDEKRAHIQPLGADLNMGNLLGFHLALKSVFKPCLEDYWKWCWVLCQHTICLFVALWHSLSTTDNNCYQTHPVSTCVTHLKDIKHNSFSTCSENKSRCHLGNKCMRARKSRSLPSLKHRDSFALNSRWRSSQSWK